MAVVTADCEAANGGLLTQEVNAWSSIGYVLAGLVVLAGVARGRLPRVFALLAAVTVLEGVGSVAYHGRASDLSQLAHDLPLVGLVGFVAGWHLGRLGNRPAAGATIGTATALVIGLAAWPAGAAGVNAVVGLAVVAVVVGEVVARARRLPPVWTAPLLVLLGAGLAAWAAGRGASPLCDPASPLQAHGLWHLLSAMLVPAWANRAVATEPAVAAVVLAGEPA
jgi:hypothetical protein